MLILPGNHLTWLIKFQHFSLKVPRQSIKHSFERKFTADEVVFCTSTNFENINNSRMKNTDSMSKIINKNVDMESNKQVRENAEKDVRTKEKFIRNVFEICKNEKPLKRFQKMIEAVLNVESS